MRYSETMKSRGVGGCWCGGGVLKGWIDRDEVLVLVEHCHSQWATCYALCVMLECER